jgi:hypothetical protein
MSAPHWGFVPINKLESAADFKRLNTELEALWHKILGNMLMKDFRDLKVDGGDGTVSVSGTTPTINALPGMCYICGEVATLGIVLPASGIVDVIFTSGSTPTVLTVTPPTGMTMKWANGFDPAGLEANTTYEITVRRGNLASIIAWA